MRPRTLAHISDLHLRTRAAAERAEALCAALLEANVDHVAVTGDVTHRGHDRDLALFRDLFRPLIRAGRLTLVPGNHDRMGEDCARVMMGDGVRVRAERHERLYLVRVDSTAPHNRSLVTGHGALDTADVEAIETALDRAPAGALTCVMLHHHLMPLPEEDLFERLAGWMGQPWTAEIAGGQALIERLCGRCDLVLHGHRHVPSEAHLDRGTRAGGRRPLSVFNAGATLALGRARVFTHQAGRLLCKPRWLAVAPPGKPSWSTWPGGSFEPSW